MLHFLSIQLYARSFSKVAYFFPTLNKTSNMSLTAPSLYWTVSRATPNRSSTATTAAVTATVVVESSRRNRVPRTPQRLRAPPKPGPGLGASGSGAASGGSAAAGPAAAAVVGVQVAKDAATAGPKAGAELGQQAETAADAAGHTPTTNDDGNDGENTSPAPLRDRKSVV